MRHFMEERHYFGIGTHLLLVCGIYGGFVQILYPRLPLRWRSRQLRHTTLLRQRRVTLVTAHYNDTIKGIRAKRGLAPDNQYVTVFD